MCVDLVSEYADQPLFGDYLSDCFCEDCKSGYYSPSSTNQPCLECPLGLASPKEGASAIQNCTICRDGYCSSVGTVSQEVHNKSTDPSNWFCECKCAPLTYGVTCEGSYWNILFGGIFGSLILAFIIGRICNLRRWKTRAKTIHIYVSESQGSALAMDLTRAVREGQLKIKHHDRCAKEW